jgi:hypothetical protein
MTHQRPPTTPVLQTERLLSELDWVHRQFVALSSHLCRLSPPLDRFMYSLSSLIQVFRYSTHTCTSHSSLFLDYPTVGILPSFLQFMNSLSRLIPTLYWDLNDTRPAVLYFRHLWPILYKITIFIRSLFYCVCICLTDTSSFYCCSSSLFQNELCLYHLYHLNLTAVKVHTVILLRLTLTILICRYQHYYFLHSWGNL